MSSFPNNYLTAPQNGNHGDLVEGHRNKMLSHYFNDGIWVMLYSVSDDGVVHWDSKSSVKMAAKFMKRDTFEISTATHHQHPCRTFVLVFGMTLELKNLRKTIFEFYQFPMKIILVGLCLKALNSIKKLHNLLNE